MLEVPSCIRLENVHYLPNGHFGGNPEHEVNVVLVMIDFEDLQLRVMSRNLFERFTHVRKNSLIEDFTTVFGTENKMVNAVIDAVGLFFEDGLHTAILAGRRRNDFIPRLTPGVLRWNYKK